MGILQAKLAVRQPISLKIYGSLDMNNIKAMLEDKDGQVGLPFCCNN